MKKATLYTILFFWSISLVGQQLEKFNIRLGYNLTAIGKNASIGVAKRIGEKNLTEIQLRIHQNRQYLLYNTPDFWKRVHAFSNSQFFGIGVVQSRVIPIKKIFCTPMISYGIQYTHAGIKAQVFEPYSQYYDSSLQQTVQKVEVVVYKFKPMHIVEQTLQLRLRFHVQGIFYMDYSGGIACAYEWKIDPALKSGKNQNYWLWSPTASVGLVFKLVK